MQAIIHPIPPLYNENSNILILGSFPSPKSREVGFFYGNKQNKFWKILGEIFDEAVPENVEGKTEYLYRHKIALWDVIHSCEIDGASDSSIKNVVANDFDLIFSQCEIKAVFTTGLTATKLYKKLTHRESIYLPSPSPANCAKPFYELVDSYKIIKEYL
jgi:hypoxanthine-DNA glycosylase